MYNAPPGSCEDSPLTLRQFLSAVGRCVRPGRVHPCGEGAGAARPGGTGGRHPAADGVTVAGIAGKLHLSEAAVRDCLSSATGKTGTRDRMDAVRAARRQGRL